MRSVPSVRHVHANVPIVSARDVDLVESPIADGACEPPVSGWPGVVRGRDAEIGKLHGLAVGITGGTAVLSGQPGCGKTTIALGMARRLIEERRNRTHHRVFWISAQNNMSFIDGLAAVARKLEVSDAEIARRRKESQPDLAWQLLTPPPEVGGQHLRNVLVIDNADDPRLASDIVRRAMELDPDDWLVVITTRVKRLPSSATITVLHVDWPSTEACAELLLDRIRELDRSHRESALPSARLAVGLLGRVPLALHLAGSNQGSSIARHTLSSYVDELERVRVRRPGLRADEPAYHLLPAMNLALGAFASEERHSALQIMSLLAACAPGQPFPLGALIAVVESTPDPADHHQAKPAVFRSIRLLRETGIVEVSTHDDPHVAVIHPLVAKASGHVDGMRAAVTRTAAHALDAITEGIDTASAVFVGEGIGDTWSLWRLLIPHITHVLNSPASAGDLAALRAAHRAIHHLMNRGMYRSAADMAAAAQRVISRQDLPDAARRTVLLDRGLALHACGDDPAGAYRYINEATLKARRECTRDDPQAMVAEHYLASILHDQGKIAASEKLFGQVLAEREAHLGPDHLDTLTTTHRLALVLQEAGRATDAERLLLKVHRGLAGQLGPDHPDTLSARHSLAYARQAGGGPTSLEDAERDFSEVLVDRIRVLGHTHPNTLITRHNLAWIEQAKGNYARAEEEFRDVMRAQIKRLGKVHPHTVATAANLAWDLLQQKQFAAARLLFTQVLKIRVERLGLGHPDTQTTRGNIGWLTYEEKDFHLAEHRFRKLRDDRAVLLGQHHPRTLTTRHNLALSLRSQNKLHAARDEFIAVLADQRNFVGEGHDSTLATMYNLAFTLRMLNEKAWLTEAMELLDRVLRILRERPDPNNPLMRRTKREIVTLLAIKSGRADVHELVDDEPESNVEAPETTVDDPLIRAFVDDDIDDFADPDLVDYVPPAGQSG